MKTITKAEAKKQGLPRYFTGKACAKGHIAEKYINSDKCIECHAARNKSRKRGKVAKSRAVVPSGTPTNGGNSVDRASAWGGLARRVKALVEKADKAADKAEQFYKSAGLTIKEIKEKFPDNWEAIVHDECGIGRSRAYELMGIADGTTTLERVRYRSNRSSQISRAKKSAEQRTAVESPVIERPGEVAIEQRQAEMAALDDDATDAEVVEETPPTDDERREWAEEEAADDREWAEGTVRYITSVRVSRQQIVFLIEELQKLLGGTSSPAMTDRWAEGLDDDDESDDEAAA